MPYKTQKMHTSGTTYRGYIYKENAARILRMKVEVEYITRAKKDYL